MKRLPLAKRARDIRRLEAAWRVIRANGSQSASKRTRDEVEEFAHVAGTELRRIQTSLRAKCFEFPKALGIAIDRGPTKDRRPIVKSPIAGRIVQRSIHDCLMGIPAVKSFVENPNSFGGTARRDEDGRAAVPAAIAETIKEIKRGAVYFIRSDIGAFFTKIPKPTVLKILEPYVPDAESKDLLERAIYIELENMATLRRRGFGALFPIQDIGVAQGNCLSPLLGNILLKDFDAFMSEGSCRCLRHIDDFILLGPDKRVVRQRFQRAVTYLKQFNMTAYDPRKDRGKAEQGAVSDGFDFLGINLKNGLVRPAAKSRRRFLQRIDDVLSEGIEKMENDSGKMLNQRHSLIRTLTVVGGIVKGWAEQYSYCNERNVFQTLDREIDKRIAGYIGRYTKARSKTTNADYSRRLLGVALLSDTEKRNIIS